MKSNTLDIEEITFRDGQREDRFRLAALDVIAGDGAIDFLFHDLIPGMTPEQIVADGYDKDHFPHTFRNAVVAEDQHHIIGFALSFPSKYHMITPELQAFLPPDRLAHFHDFFSTRVEDSFFLDALAVEEKYRNKGIGGHLIHLTKAKALREGFTILSLMTFADNVGAIHLYQKMGFESVQKIALEAHPLMPHEGGCLLMKCVIA